MCWGPPLHHGVDTTRNPPRPNTGDILLDGPTLHVYDSDPPGQLVELSSCLIPRYPYRGQGCTPSFFRLRTANQGEFDIIANSGNPYPYGIYWQTGRQQSLLSSRCRGGGDILDLIFDIEFCRPDQLTPVLKRSWGQIKSIYR